jgi:NAD(P)-dependent dehydrogenase (short-subunit alcohol dehydrogenase family)
MNTSNILVSGAAGGLGICIVKRYLNEGYNVYAFARMKGTKLDKLKEQFPENLYIYEADLSRTDSVEKQSKIIAERTDRIDIIINCAAVLPGDALLPFIEVDIDKFLKVLDINALGHFRVIQKNYNLLKNGTDPIAVNISSAGASFTHIIEKDDRLEYPYAYCMSKAALNMGSAILQRYSNLDGIRVICVHPGILDTRMNAGNLFKKKLMSPEESTKYIYDLTERERIKDKGDLFFNYDGESFPY